MLQMAGTKGERIKVIGVGGAGCNAVDWLYKKGISGADIICINTDKQHLYCVEADKKVLIGENSTRGFGCGGSTEKGRAAAIESARLIGDTIGKPDMIFLIAGLGGGTGTVVTPYIARLAKENGATVISAVTIPFAIEGPRRERANIGLEELSYSADTVIVIDNEKLVELAGELPFQQAFSVANEVLASMVKGIIETVTIPSLVNVDYADVKSIMSHGGVSAIGLGESSGKNRVGEAIKKSFVNPLLEIDYKGAKAALVHIIGGPDLTLNEVKETISIVLEMLHEDSEVAWGARIDPSLDGSVRVMTIMTGVTSPQLTGMSNAQGEGLNDLGLDKVGEA